jgi:deoxyribodipyrimidine photo-lyase
VTDLPAPHRGDEAAWVAAHLGDLCADEPAPSPRFRGTQAAAHAALASFDARGYAQRRNEVAPASRRGASGLSPWIRHGLITLPEVWAHVAGGPARDVEKFRDELLWQEYARHVYARLGTATQRPMRFEPPDPPPDPSWTVDPWDRSMACIAMCLDELERDGWLVNQTRMWLASQWSVRHGAQWRDGEDRFFTHLLDGSRAANRLGWQWTIGAGTGSPYGFSQWQVRKRAPGLCGTCPHEQRCPIASWPDAPELPAVEGGDGPSLVDADPDLSATSGPSEPVVSGDPQAVWITAESLGDGDPALTTWPALPVVFVFDEPLLARLHLSGKRLVFFTERLAELGEERDLRVLRGAPAQVLAGERLAATFAPVPGWRRTASVVSPVAVHPWPWLVQPGVGSLRSFTAWRRSRRR